jgi:pyridoxal 5'-phosphate synthase pdxT subunit
VRPAIGVVAVQGGFAAHARAVEDIGARAVLVRRPAQLADVSALVLPGGESTAQLGLLRRAGLVEALRAFVADGRPVLATCAGLILAAARVRDPEQESFGWIDVTVARNAWGRQVASFEAVSDDGSRPLVFIRAPRIVDVGPGVEVRATFRGEPVLVRQANVTGATFHPELTSDRDVHREALATHVAVAG